MMSWPMSLPTSLHTCQLHSVTILHELANSYRFLRSAVDSHMHSRKLPVLARNLPVVGAYNWENTVGEEDIAEVQSSDSEIDE
jgi:hypothetical protein